MKLIICFILSFFFSILSFSCKNTSSSSVRMTAEEKNDVYTNCKVIGIKDGDTYEILIDDTPIKVRLAHIDCPEKKQDFGSKAKQYASDLCFGKIVTVKKNSTDRYKRWIVEIYLEDGTCVNEELVKAGYAWHFTKYSSSSKYAQLEKEARENQVGLWQLSNPIPPWEWRENRKKK